MASIGVDLQTNSFTVCRLQDDGSEAFETFALSASALEKFCLSLDANDEISVEATGNTAWFCDEIRACAGRVVVVNPRQFQVIRKSVNQTDRNDARALVFFLSKDMLPETRPKSTAEAELSSLVATRDVVIKQHIMLLNKIYAMFVRRGCKLTKEGLAIKKRLRELNLSQFTAFEQVEMSALRAQALGLTETLAELDEAIETAGAELPGHENISSIKGIGARSAAILLSGIGNIDDLGSAEKLATYVGIVPKVSQSNETDNRRRITKRDNKLMRTTLVQCTSVAIRYCGYLKAFYQSAKELRGAGKAIIATARNGVSIIDDTLENGWIVEDFPNFKIKENQCSAGQPS